MKNKKKKMKIKITLDPLKFRRFWTRNPVTQVKQSKKKYSRKKYNVKDEINGVV